MEIDVNQKKISIGDKYQIFIDGQLSFAASQKLFRLMPEIILAGSKGTLTIKKRLSWFKARYDITTEDFRVLEFRTISFWKRHFQCEVGSDLYEIFGHKGRKFSVYRNSRQVAWWSKKAVTWFAGDNYKIIADKDVDVDLIVSFCLIIDNYTTNENKGAFKWNVGYIGPQARQFDEGWMPKY